MKKIVLLIFVLFAALCAQAQMSLGVRVGGGFNTLTSPEVNGSSVMDYKSLLTPMAGVMACLQLSEEFDLQAELNYAMRGFKDKVLQADLLKPEDYTVRSSYLELPLLLKFYPVGRFYIQAGPQVGCLLGRSCSIKDASWGKDKTLDCGLNLGLGFEEGLWCVDLRYYLGLAKTYENTWESGFRNRGISVSVGYYLK